MNWTYLNKDEQLIPRLFDNQRLRTTLSQLVKHGFDILIWSDGALSELDYGDFLTIRLLHRNARNWSFDCVVIWKDQCSELEVAKLLSSVLVRNNIGGDAE